MHAAFRLWMARPIFWARSFELENVRNGIVPMIFSQGETLKLTQKYIVFYSRNLVAEDLSSKVIRQMKNHSHTPGIKYHDVWSLPARTESWVNKINTLFTNLPIRDEYNTGQPNGSTHLPGVVCSILEPVNTIWCQLRDLQFHINFEMFNF
jgi:hypothetical protein